MRATEDIGGDSKAKWKFLPACQQLLEASAELHARDADLSKPTRLSMVDRDLVTLCCGFGLY